MNARVDLLLADVLKLSADERSAVAAALIDSLETDNAAVVEAWRTELLLRRDELRAGLAQPAVWSAARARLSAL